MKNNREKLLHAFEDLRGETLQEAMVSMDAPAIRGMTRSRRWMTVTAACLSAVLLLGAAVALPLMTADDSPVPSVTDPVSFAGDPSYHEASIVKLMSLSAENEADSTETDIMMQMGDYERVAHEYYLLFEALEEGETLTLTSRNSRIAQANQDSKQRVQEVSEYLQTITYDATLSEGDRPVFMWAYVMSEDARIDGNVYEDCVDFIIRNVDGRITGAGSLYLADKKLMKNDENNRYYSLMSISRGQVLGSVRFDDPATVTDEQVQSLLDEMHQKVAGLSNRLFDESTFSAAEMYIKNWATILETNYPDYLGDDSGSPKLVLRGGQPAEGLRHIMISTVNEPEKVRHFFFFDDGTCAEAGDIKCVCPECGEVEIVEHPFHSSKHNVETLTEDYDHRLQSVWVCYLTDGRVMEVARTGEGNESAFTFVSAEGANA